MIPFSCKSLLLLLVFSSIARSQTFRPVTLQQIAGSAGYIFAGTVTAVDFIHPTHSNEVSTVRISFRVDQGVRGVRTGQSLLVREWAGLWNQGERYHVGQKLLLALYPPSKLGLTSPVGGKLGRFLLDSNGFLVLPSEQNQILTADPVIGTWLKGRSRVRGRSLALMLRRTIRSK